MQTVVVVLAATIVLQPGVQPTLQIRPDTKKITILADLQKVAPHDGRWSIPLPDATKLDYEWLGKALMDRDDELVQFGAVFDNGKPMARFGPNALYCRWYDRDGNLWSHAEYGSRKLQGGCLHSTQEGRRNYACQFDKSKRHGWQFFNEGYVIATKFDQERPVVTFEFRDGKIAETWFHDSKEEPNVGLKARFSRAENAAKEFRAAEAKQRRDVYAWIKEYRRLMAGQLARGRRARTLAKHDARQDALAAGLIKNMVQQSKANPLMDPRRGATLFVPTP